MQRAVANRRTVRQLSPRCLCANIFPAREVNSSSFPKASRPLWPPCNSQLGYLEYSVSRTTYPHQRIGRKTCKLRVRSISANDLRSLGKFVQQFPDSFQLARSLGALAISTNKRGTAAASRGPRRRVARGREQRRRDDYSHEKERNEREERVIRPGEKIAGVEGKKGNNHSTGFLPGRSRGPSSLHSTFSLRAASTSVPLSRQRLRFECSCGVPRINFDDIRTADRRRFSGQLAE